ncbi:MAG: MOSC domain-containing protein [Candidatus Omnitrophica bacterium]|nr:MOSC domain-containing protein [Candidatus Aminicenantes bacterium]MBL7081883.1 MOSC domain-containing protein [Candidatus Omnitrophota bacterium]
METGKIVAVSISEKKGIKKRNVSSVELKINLGIIGDAHAEGGIRQLSLLAFESIDKMKSKGLDVAPGNFAENITTLGLDLSSLKIGTKLKAGSGVLLEISQIGKDCHSRCNIYYQAGDCIMPREGIFARVLEGGVISPGDKLEVIN